MVDKQASVMGAFGSDQSQQGRGGTHAGSRRRRVDIVSNGIVAKSLVFLLNTMIGIDSSINISLKLRLASKRCRRPTEEYRPQG